MVSRDPKTSNQTLFTFTKTECPSRNIARITVYLQHIQTHYLCVGKLIRYESWAMFSWDINYAASFGEYIRAIFIGPFHASVLTSIGKSFSSSNFGAAFGFFLSPPLPLPLPPRTPRGRLPPRPLLGESLKVILISLIKRLLFTSSSCKMEVYPITAQKITTTIET